MKQYVSHNFVESNSASIIARREYLPVEPDGSVIVSFGERELLFATHCPEGWYEVTHTDESSISLAKIMHFLDTYKRVAITSEDSLLSFLKFASQMVWVEAAGGVVENESGEVVMIRRNERWDLPKGHREEGEDFRLCAAREAEEETGAHVLEVDNLLATTLHGYNLYGKWELKLTVWYAMRGSAQLLTPQQEEGIICAEWIARDQIKDKIKTSFPTIRKVFDAFLTRKA